MKRSRQRAGPRFVTVTLNPALDCTLTVDAPLRVGGVHRVVSETRTPGGKGVNVAKALAANGCRVTAGGILGKKEEAAFVSFLKSIGVAAVFLTVPAPTRENVMAASARGEEIKFNRPGFPGLRMSWRRLRAYCLQLAARGDVLILCGSLPDGFAQDTYARLVTFLRGAGKTVVLDTSGPPLAAAVARGPDVIKPNRAELADILGVAPRGQNGLVAAARELAGRHEAVIVSDGPRGAYFARGQTVLFAASPRVKAVDTTGAGDALLGQFCADYFGRSRRRLDARVAARCVAAGAAAVEVRGTPVPDVRRIRELARDVQVVER